MGLFWYIGAGVATFNASKLGLWAYKEFLRPTQILTQRYGFSSWAVINGAPLYYADELASHKFNLIFIGNNTE